MGQRILVELHREQALRLGPRIALRYKKNGLYHDLAWSDYYEQTQTCASALLDHGIMPGDRVGILSENRPEWLVADIAVMAAGAITVPPHAPLTARQIAYQFHETGVRWLFVSTVGQYEKYLQIRAELPQIQGVLIFDGQIAAAISWDGFLQRGRNSLDRNRAELERRAAAIRTDDLATIMYTSGTTGVPKGVMLTHGNLLSNAVATNQASPREEGAVLLNWLPFSHIYARTVDHYLSMVAAVPMCLAESAETLMQNLAETQPTHLSSVPRFYEKVLAAVSGADVALSRKRLCGIFGKRVAWLSSGGAPLPLGVAKAYEEAGLLLLQGYGLTESAPVISFNHNKAYKLATVGRAIPGVDIAIAPDGEVLTRGPHVMKGYWNDPAATAEAIRDGWLHTGDLGEIDADGYLTITGRKKDLLVLSSGKKIVPCHIEGLLIGDPCIDQAVVYGEGKSFLSALIVPNWQNVREAMKLATCPMSGAELAKDAEVYAFMEGRVATALAELSAWERVKKFVILAEPFSIAADELTVSLKLRRQVILARHQTVLDKLY
jgi:long-chain acyl-CoA synthetase